MYCASVSKFNDEPTVVVIIVVVGVVVELVIAVALLIVVFKLSIKILSFIKIDLIVSVSSLDGLVVGEVELMA